MGKGFKLRMALLPAYVMLALLVVATAVQALTAPAPAPCANGVHDGDESGVDCGGSCALTVGCMGNCTSAYVVDYCDGKDNDRDCKVDEDCKPRAGVVTAPIIVKGSALVQQAEAQNCSDSLQNQDELAVDCGGICTTDSEEFCDGIDNDKDCIIDEGCKLGTQVGAQTQEASESPQKAPAAEQSGLISVPASVPSNLVQSVAAQVAPSYQPPESDIGPDDSVNQAAEIRRLAKRNAAYIPDNESDNELIRKYQAFASKHEKELEAKSVRGDTTEKDIAEVLNQFSKETYTNPVQTLKSQSFFSKVKGFFKKLFG